MVANAPHWPPRESALGSLMAIVAQPGVLRWIGVRPAYRAPMQIVKQAELESDRGVIGDRSAFKSGGKRQVTLIQFEHLAVIAALCGRQDMAPELLRRNLVVSGINLLALKDARFAIGDVMFEGTGLCQPCSRMEEALGRGGYNAMRGHGGITARVLAGAKISLGDKIMMIEAGPCSAEDEE